MKREKSLILGVTTVAVTLLLAACGNSGSKETAKTDTASFATSDVIATMDSALNTDVIGAQALTDTMEGLYRYEGKDIKPAIATKIVKPTNNGLTYTFPLRKNAKWSNGQPVTAADFVNAWRRVVDPKVGSQYAYIYEGIKNAADITTGKQPVDSLGVIAKDQHTLEVTLEKPIPYFSQLMTSSTFFPQYTDAVQKAGKRYGTNSKTLVFNGPYKLENWNGPDSSWQEVKNTKYWNAKAVKVKTLKYQVVKDPSTALNLFQSNKLDRTSISGDTAKQMKNDTHYSTLQKSATFYMQVNQEKNPIFKNPKIRQAISMTINRKELVAQVLGDGSSPISALTPKNMSFNPTTKQDFVSDLDPVGKQNATYKPKEAAKLWKEGLAETGQTGKTFNYTLLGDDTDAAKKQAEYLQNTLEKNLSGLKVTLANVPFKTRLTRSTNGDFDMVVSAWNADFPDPITFLDLFVTGGDNNNGHWSNAEYDAQIKASKVDNANDPNARWQNLVKAQDIMNTESGVIPLYQSGVAYLTNPSLKGLDYGPSGNYNNVSLYLKK
ncbi:peptide ABC transporter substrate-binding protein [Latilactobacillus graminis]|uniref:Peptide ABC transporter, peptide-binding protein n=2 Tax=Latilactobacillus graminis TaxID=60519 RepID=A0AA89I280_9LACO|nr:peptide ABC transporter substrate-binding protein [Latilactobacillus graminis]KRM23986.1 peptide ABC transporter, peptide-binding protein [Latilactobacillus graminis DSM 20719]QFP79850.1 peptide ABC transporter substrate-binding protein [Latilactobacillus graminis]